MASVDPQPAALQPTDPAGPNPSVRRPTTLLDLHPDLLRRVASYVPRNEVAGSLKLTIKNGDNKAIDLEALDNAYGASGPWTLSVPAKKTTERSWSFQNSARWYDITIKHAGFERRFAGRIENGLPSTSDPVLGIAI